MLPGANDNFGASGIVFCVSGVGWAFSGGTGDALGVIPPLPSERRVENSGELGYGQNHTSHPGRSDFSDDPLVEW